MTFYRYEDPSQSGERAWEREFRMVKETLCGHWIESYRPTYSRSDRRRWVSKTARKRFAYPTKELAWESYKARKKRQVEIYRHRLRKAQFCYALLKPEKVYYNMEDLCDD